MHVVSLPELHEPIRIIYDRKRASLKDYLAFCSANPDLRIERTAQGEIVLMPPAGFEASYRSNKVAAQLDRWAEVDGRGKASDSSAEFVLPDGSALSPYVAWVSNQSLSRLSRQQRRQFPPLCPEFVVEVMSPSDRLIDAKRKMSNWISNGAHLGWLIDADHKTIYIFRPGKPVRTVKGKLSLAGEGPVQGFVLHLKPIWDGVG